MKTQLKQEIDFIKSIVDSKFIIEEFTKDEEENLYQFTIKELENKCHITYIKGFDVYLLTTIRNKDNKVLTFEHEFWFEDYNNQNLILQFNNAIKDFLTENIESLLDKKYPCQIEYN